MVKIKKLLREIIRKMDPSLYVLSDVDGDGKPEVVMLIKGKYLRTFYGEREYIYELIFMDSLDKNPVKRMIARLRKFPKNMLIKDINDDGLADIVYLQKGEYLCMRHGGMIFLYRLMCIPGKGKGRFGEPYQIATLRGEPERI